MNINFESRPVYGDNDKYIKAKIKVYADSIITNFHKNKIPKENVPCKCLSIIMLDSVIKANKNYYLQMLLEECKYIQEKINIVRIILMKTQIKVNQIATLTIRLNLILIMINIS